MVLPLSPCRIAVIGSGVSGLAAAWLLERRHHITLFEQAHRFGGHANTVTVKALGGDIGVDTGFIVFNRSTYPNLTALLTHLGVETCATEMSFSVSRHNGGFEYGGSGLAALFAQPANALSPSFWSMLRDLRRFYATATDDLDALERAPISLGTYLRRNNYGERFCEDHILPMAAAIWSASATKMLEHPAAAFIRFFDNHGLLKLSGRPLWHTIVGGSRVYVDKMMAPLAKVSRRHCPVAKIRRDTDGVTIQTTSGHTERFDHVVIATHADDALCILDSASSLERQLLGAFKYTRNRAVLHTDRRFMPRRKSVWSSWNYIERGPEDGGGAHLTYWMNRLQGIDSEQPLLVTINPEPPPDARLVLHTEAYAHPVFDLAAMRAQQSLWSLQGQHRTWFCGAYFGAGFHEDGLQAGLAVGEDLGGLKRPWTIDNPSSRIAHNADAVSARLEAAS